MSMDCMFVDITDLDIVNIGDDVVFIGGQRNIEITATDHAEYLEVYSCEVLSQINTNRFNIIVD